jgi:flagellar motor switch/type III secretory pathway protein FliN
MLKLGGKNTSRSSAIQELKLDKKTGTIVTIFINKRLIG